MDRLRKFLGLMLRHKGMSASLVLHFCLFLLLIFSFPQCHRKMPDQVIISLDLLPINQMTNIENKQNTVKAEPKEKVIEKPKPAEKPVEEVEEKKLEPKPEPAPEVAKVEEKKKEKEKEKVEEKPAPKPKPAPKKDEKKKKKPKPKVDEYEEMLKNLTKSAENESDVEEKVEKVSKGPHNSNAALSMSLKDSIKRQIEQCWSPPAGNKDAGKMQVLIDINFKPDGSVAHAKIVHTGRYASDELYKVAADAALRAVYKCSPLQGLPVEQYSTWENIEFNFDPSEMIY